MKSRLMVVHLIPHGDAKGQMLSEKVAQSHFVLGDGKETQQRPDLYRKIGACAERTFHGRKSTIGAKRV